VLLTARKETHKMPSQRWTLAVVSIATAMLMLDIAVVNTALSSIAADLNTGLSGLQWVVDAYTLALASTVLSAGFLADRLGRKRMLIIGLTLFTASSVAAGAAGSIEFLVAARAVQGFGAAILFAVSLALIAATFPDYKDRAGALAVYGATIGGSFAIGPLVGGALTSGLSWQWIFLVNLPIGIAAIAIARTKVAESKDPFPRSLDYPGQATIVGSLFLLVLALLRGNEQGWGSTPIVLELAGAAALFIAFIAVERRAKEPMLPLEFFRIRMFTGAQLAVFAISSSFFAVFLYSTLYLQNVLGLSAIEAGLVYLPGTMVNFVVAGASASFVPKMPTHVPVALGLALIAVGMVLFTSADVDSSWTVFLPGLLIAMVGTGLVNVSLSGVAMSILPERQNGLASGAHDMFRQGGIAVGIAALGALVPAHAALGGDPQAYVDGLNNAMVVGAVIAAVGAVVAWFMIRPARQPAGAADLAGSGLAAEAA
jgi:EmrB/QacA subfamily drug resistance transporter